MSEGTKDQHQDLKDSKHGIITIAGIAVCVVVGLLARNDLLFGLVMGAVYSSGMGVGKKVAAQIAQNAGEAAQPAKIIGPIAAGIVTGIIALIIISVIRGAIGEASFAVAPEDNIIVQIVKHFFDGTAAIAVGAGVVVNGLALGMSGE